MEDSYSDGVKDIKLSKLNRFRHERKLIDMDTLVSEVAISIIHLVLDHGGVESVRASPRAEHPVSHVRGPNCQTQEQPV